MAINITKIAKMAGLSASTVSRATNPDTRYKVKDFTLKRIDALTQRYGYTPNLAARNLVKPQATKVIGVAFPYVPNIFYSSYFTHILSGVANFFINSEYQCKIILLKEESRKWDNFDFRAGEGIEGLIITQWFRFFSRNLVTKNLQVPMVVINDYDENVRTRFVCEDGFAGGKTAARHFYEAGHRDIAVINGPLWSRDSKARIRGFYAFFDENKLPIDKELIAQSHWDDDNQMRAAVDNILEKNRKVTAIFCCNDNLAFGAINRIQELGLNCPGDISVIGYDDDFRAAGFNPPLTTIQVPVYDLAQKAASILLEHLKGNISKKDFPGLTLVPVRLIERASVRKI